MKKMISALTLTFLIFSCSGFGGEKIESEDTNALILQTILLCQTEMEEELEQAMFEENYVFDNDTATMNVHYSTSCGLKTTERTAYKVALNQWSISAGLYLTNADLENNKKTICKVTISGNVRGERQSSTWSSASNKVQMDEVCFINDDTDGLTVTVHDTIANKNVYSGSVFTRLEVKSSFGSIGGKYNFYSRINGAVYEAPRQIWIDAFQP